MVLLIAKVLGIAALSVLVLMGILMAWFMYKVARTWKM